MKGINPAVADDESVLLIWRFFSLSTDEALPTGKTAGLYVKIGGTVKAGGFLGNHALIDHVWYRIIPNSTTAEVFELDDYNYTGNIVIPELISYDRNSYTVTTIRKKAFYESRVTSIEIPKTITSIGSLAFAQYCTRYNMTSIICHMEKPIDVEEGTFGYVDEDYKERG